MILSLAIMLKHNYCCKIYIDNKKYVHYIIDFFVIFLLSNKKSLRLGEIFRLL